MTSDSTLIAELTGERTRAEFQRRVIASQNERIEKLQDLCEAQSERLEKVTAERDALEATIAHLRRRINEEV